METEEKKIHTAPAQKEEEEKKDKKRWLLLLLLLLLLLILVLVGIWLLYFRGGSRDNTLPPDNTLPAPSIETNAESIAGDDTGEKLDAPEGGGAVSLTYSKEVSIDLTEKKASLVFGNPARSNQDAVVQLVIQNTVILRSGSLTPGTQVTALNLAEGAAEKLTAGVYEGKFVVSFYDQPTGRWATLNAEIPVTVTVTR